MKLGRRLRLLVGSTVVLLPMLAASWAWACTPEATVETEEAVVEQGAEVRGEGRGFSESAAGDAEVRLDGEEGQLLWRGRPDAAGGFDFAFTMPDVEPRTYVLLAIQREADGSPVFGTPARTTIEVTARPASEVAPASATSEPARDPAPAPAPAPVSRPAEASAPEPPLAAVVAPADATVAVPAAEAVAAPPAAPVEAFAAPPAAVFEPEGVAPLARDAAPTPASVRRPSGGPAPDVGALLWLPFALVGVGIVLACSAAVVALRSGRDGVARAARRRI